MPAYPGKYQYLDESGASLDQGPCELGFDAETCAVTPSGPALAFDLGDVDRVAPGEWELRLTLYAGRAVVLRQFGAAFGRMSEELLAAWRDRTVRCLLLEDLEEIARFDGAVAGSTAEIRIYKSNLAVLPAGAAPIQWRLAEVDSVGFDEAAYTVTLASGAERLVVGKLARKTGEFRQKLGDTLEALRRHQAEALHTTFPFLSPDQLRKLVTTMPEGRSVPLAALAAIHPKLPDALVTHAVDEPLKPYFDELRRRATGEPLMAGFKFTRPDEDRDESEDEPQGAEAAEEPPLFFWFFFPLGGKVAWEATTGSGRATYFFRAPGPVEEAVRRLTRGLALVSFRREPVYLPDESLERQQRYRRYAIGARKLPDLLALRSAFLGRAIHSTPEAWKASVDELTR